MSSTTLSRSTYVPRQRVARPAPAAAPTRTAPRGQVRLTRRGRLVVFLASLMLVLGAALFLGATSVATGEKGTDQPTEKVMVGEGDTLWDIAAGLADDGEVRAMMTTIRELNALDSSMLVAGQELFVPVAD
jgi:hypothetical protein